MRFYDSISVSKIHKINTLYKEAKDFLQEFIMYKTVENEDYEGLDSALLSYSGFGPQLIRQARGGKHA